ncbi:hypothetical protein HYD50_00945 [Mycoplasmopsis bovis]|nr:hypothetical protein [Mycoplasmopsis bovis]QQH72484.1 hypothetical protein HYD50_00945 [Mycoplasmopsis bovis]
MAIPVEIRQVERPKKQLKEHFGKFKVKKNQQIWMKSNSKRFGIVGEIVDKIPLKHLSVGTRSRKTKKT